MSHLGSSADLDWADLSWACPRACSHLEGQLEASWSQEVLLTCPAVG